MDRAGLRDPIIHQQGLWCLRHRGPCISHFTQNNKQLAKENTMTPQDLAAIAYAELRVTISDPAPTKMLASTRIRAMIIPEAKNDDCRTDYRIGRDDGLEAAAALEPDPTPALGWKAMQTAAAEAVAKEAHGETVLGGQRFKTVKLEDAVEAILALPGPTDEQLLADAVKLPEVQSLVEYARDASSALAYIQLIHGRLSGIGWERLAGLQLACAPIEDALAKIGGAA